MARSHEPHPSDPSSPSAKAAQTVKRYHSPSREAPSDDSYRENRPRRDDEHLDTDASTAPGRQQSVTVDDTSDDARRPQDDDYAPRHDDDHPMRTDSRRQSNDEHP